MSKTKESGREPGRNADAVMTTAGLLVENAGTFLAQQFPEREALVAPWLRQRQNSLLYAPSGIGKSFLAWSIALAVSGGGSLGLWKAPKPRKVLFVDGEMDAQDLWERLKGMLDAAPAIDVGAVKRNLELLARQRQKPGIEFPDLDKADGRAAVLGIARTLRAELVVLDNFSTLCAVDEENAASSWNGMQHFLIALKQEGVASLLVHHSRKGGREKDSYRGTSKMGVVFDTILRLEEPPDTQRPADGSAAFKLTFEKVRAKRDKSTEPTVMALQGFGWCVSDDGDGDLDLLLRLHQQLKFTTTKDMMEHFGRDKTWVSRKKTKAIALNRITESEWEQCFERAKRCQDADGNPATEVAPEEPDF